MAIIIIVSLFYIFLFLTAVTDGIVKQPQVNGTFLARTLDRFQCPANILTSMLKFFLDRLVSFFATIIGGESVEHNFFFGEKISNYSSIACAELQLTRGSYDGDPRGFQPDNYGWILHVEILTNPQPIG